MAGGLSGLLTAVFGGETVDKSQKGVQEQTTTGTSGQLSTTDTTALSSTQTGAVQSSTSDTKTSSSGQSQSLSNEALADLQNSLNVASKSYTPADLAGVAQRISGVNNSVIQMAQAQATRAQGADAALGGGIDDIVNAARQTLTRQLATKQTQLSAQTGSSFNTVLQETFARDATDANIQLAGLKAQLLETSRAQATQEMSAALSGLQGAAGSVLSTEGQIPALMASIDATRSSSVANIANSLKGGLTTTSAMSDAVANSRNETQQTVNARSATTVTGNTQNMINNTQDTQSEGSGVTNTNTSFLDLLNALNTGKK